MVSVPRVGGDFKQRTKLASRIPVDQTRGMVVLEFVRRFFLFHFPSWGKDKEKNAALSRLIDRLQHRKSSPYDPLRNTLAPAFAEDLAKLALVANRMRPAYEKTIVRPGTNRALAETGIVRKALGGQGQRLESFSFPVLAEPFLSRGAEGLREVDQAFERIMVTFQNPPFPDLARGYRTNRRLAEVSRFDFPSLLQPFRAQGAVPGAYGPASGERVVVGLQDLAFLTTGLQLDPTASAVWLTLTELAGPEASGGEPPPGLNELSGLMTGPLEPGYLADVIRCILLDPNLAIRVADPEGDLLRGTVQALIDDYQDKKGEFLRLQADELFRTKVRDLFGDLALDELEGYSRQTSELLTGRNLPDFRFIQPLTVLKNFFAKLYQPRLRPLLGSYFLDMDFKNKEFKTAMVEAVVTLDHNASRIEPFQEEAGTMVLTRITPVLATMEKGIPDRAVKEKVKKAVDTINEMAGRFSRDNAKALGRLVTALAQIQADLAATAPELLVNGFDLLSRKPRLKADLADAIELFDKAAKLLER